jgi:hypothetical protein
MDSDMMWDLDFSNLEPDYDRGYWTTKNEKRISIREMETSHIKNTINLLKRNIEKLDDTSRDYYDDYFNYKINELEKELRVRDVYLRHIMEAKNES